MDYWQKMAARYVRPLLGACDEDDEDFEYYVRRSVNAQDQEMAIEELAAAGHFSEKLIELIDETAFNHAMARIKKERNCE